MLAFSSASRPRRRSERVCVAASLLEWGPREKNPNNSGFDPPGRESEARRFFFFCDFLLIRNFQGKEWGAFYLADRRILKTQEDAVRLCNLHCSGSKEGQEIKCPCLCPVSGSCLPCKSLEVFNDFSHHHGDTETREGVISSLLSFFLPFFFFHSSALLFAILPWCLGCPRARIMFPFAVYLS